MEKEKQGVVVQMLYHLQYLTKSLQKGTLSSITAPHTLTWRQNREAAGIRLLLLLVLGKGPVSIGAVVPSAP
jgi:hypothetical protein